MWSENKTVAELLLSYLLALVALLGGEVVGVSSARRFPPRPRAGVPLLQHIHFFYR
jgi:hypothetical protein